MDHKAKQTLKLSRPVKEKNPYLELILRDMPLILNLDSSFWDNPKFLRWQILRLNKDYQKDVQTFWGAIQNWQEGVKAKHVCGDFARDDLLFDIQFFKAHYPPDVSDSYNDWVNDQITNTKISDFFNKYPGVGSSSWRQQCEDHIHWIGRIFNANLTLFKQDQYNIGEIEIEMGLTDSKKKITLNPRNLGSLRPCPIPWQIRFPFIFCLETLHPWPVKGKGRPQDWRLNVLVYELSQAGIKDKEIGNLLRKCPIPNLLFGAIKHYEGTLDKDPILVRINTIKRTVEKAVSQAYPFTAST